MERYGAATGPPPAGVEARPTDWYGEVLYWLPGPGTIVAGDVLLGDGRGGIRLADEWLRDDREQVRAALLPLRELPIERVLAAHAEPVVEDGRAALERALTA